ncbi:hypothetical protein DEU56DRAFT_749614 [Suillus clintonianus]|uniref:uncharacterized protein n=1 Tax=Suillus clintonianus TaxID=1904413 RepID=UPI001B87156D|nr:uncharacterized protein DEU56DRAFT_749614 [Suillus clintonianus]KAG2111432.1 hypothetical protein DEU56DRAFT_749614 [Suillus clintonianus]
MSDNAETTQTFSSNPSSESRHEFNQDSVSQCLKLVDDYRKGTIEKGTALLEIQIVLQAAISQSDVLTQLDFKPGFIHFLELLDHASDESSSVRGAINNGNEPRNEPSIHSRQGSVESGTSKEKNLRKRLRRRDLSEEDESSESGNEHEYVLRGKRRKLTTERACFYPWLEPTLYRHVSSKRAEELTLGCYEEWTEETKYYRGQVTATPGCPSFPLSQWTLLLEGRAPDLEKVLSGHYSTIIDPKQSQSLRKGFEITVSQPTTTHKVKTYGDWSIATDLWIEALTFIMPWKEVELRGYKRYLSSLFIDVHYALHTRILDFDKACRLKIEGRKYLRFDDITEFRRLEVSHLSSLGMVAYADLHQLSAGSGEKAVSKGSGFGKKGRSDQSSRGEACHNWNRGACDKSSADCPRFHVCSRCRGGHQRGYCSMAKAAK